MSKKSTKKPAGKAKPHKTIKKVVQQVGKAAEAETLEDLKQGKKVSAAKSKAEKGDGNSIKSQLLPKVLAEFEKDTESGVRRASKEIAEAIGFDVKQVVKYVSHYEKGAYEAWKSLPKAEKDKPEKADKADKSDKPKKPRKATKFSKRQPQVGVIPDEEETTSEE
jgi:hypothetical protein